MSTYYTIITNTGKAQFATASQNTTKVNITHLAVGDGNGTVPTPNGARTALVKETARVAVNKVGIHAANKNWIEVHAIIPSSSGGYTVRELGLYAGTTLIAIGSFPATYKPSATEGGAREMSIKVIIAVDNASVVNVTLDNSLVYATQKWVEDNFVNHNEVINTLTATDTDKPLSAAQGKALQDNKADKATTITAGNGLTGGGTLQASRTVALGTPSQITASTTNSVTATSHTHAIDKASTTVAGVVQLNDTLASTATDQALTANQGKVLNDKITTANAAIATKANQATTITAGNGLTGGGTLQASRTVALGTPSQITASTTNSVTATSHTHAIDKASTTVAGVVQLVDNLTTDDATKALTAKQGKALKDELDTTVKLTGDQTITGRKTFGEITVSPAGIDNSLIMGVGSGDIYIKNTVANKYLQFKNDGTLAISNDKVWLYSDRSDAVNLDRTDKVATAKAVKSLNDTKLGKTENAISATKLQTARTINGVAFDGTANITITDNTKAPAVHRHNWSEIDSIPPIISNPTQIISGDLDDYKNTGFYFCSANVHARAIANTASNRAFSLQVVEAAGVVQIFREYETAFVYVRAFYQTWSAWKRLATTDDNAPTATKLQTARTISTTGDATWSVSFDGSTNASGTLTLANSGVTAGSYNSVTVDAKGRVTRGLTQVHGLITATTATGTANQATTNGNTYLNIVASGVGSAASVGSSTQVTGTNGISISSDTAGKLIISRDSNSPTATQLQTPRTINGVAFDGTQNITIYDNTKLASNANAVSASRLATARTISLTGAVTGSVSFNGTANVNIATTLNLADFANSKTENGYQKLPNGLIIQWGNGQAGKIGTNYANRFPITFPTLCINAQAIHIGEDARVNTVVNSITTTGFNARSDNTSSVYIYWLAIGY